MKEKIVETHDFSQLLREEHIDKWVAISPDYSDLLAVGSTLSELLRKTSKIKEKVVLQVPQPLGYAP